MKINYPMTITAADVESRTLTGRIVTWGEEGNTSAGRTVFSKDSIQFNKNVKLLLEHELTRPIGKMVSAEVTDTGIEAKFKLANTSAASDALVEAAEGLRDGFSVGVKLTTQGEQVSDTTVPAPAVETVEAPVAEVQAKSAPMFTAPRVNLNVTPGQFALAQIRAAQGDSDARDLVAALEVATTSENIGVVPPTYLRDLIGIIDDSMPFADSLEQGTLPASGMKFYRPVIGVQATTAITAEGVELDSTDTTITSLEVDVVKIGGANVINAELIERSDPSYVDVLLRELAASWAQKADAYAFSIAAGAPGSSSGATLYAGIADGIADAFGVLRRTPNRFLADTGNFAELLAAVDLDGRPLFAAAAPSNAAGLMTQGSTAGTIAGLGLVVDPNIDTGTGVKGVVYASDAATFYRSPAIQIRSNVVANAQYEIGVYGYVACARKYATAFRNITVA